MTSRDEATDAAAAIRRSDALIAAEDWEANARLLAEAAERFPRHRAIQSRAAALLFDLHPDLARRCIEPAADVEPADPDTPTQCAEGAFDLAASP